MSRTTVEFRTVPGTRAAVGRSGAHTVIADRPAGKAGGMGLGFNGSPTRATEARIEVWCDLADGSDPAELIDRAKALTTIGNSVRAGFPVAISKA